MSATAEILSERVVIPAADGFPLAGVVVRPTRPEPKAVAHIHSATGVKKEFYLKFASFLAECGFIAVIFDYRGIGGSRPETLRGFDACMRHWGERDMTGALAWTQERFPALPKFVVGHSVGGQLLGLMPNHRLLRGALLVASSSGFWRMFPPPYKYFTAFMWYAFIPLTTSALGYAPAKRFGLGEDLPKGVAREWALWCKNAAYFGASFGKTIATHQYDEIAFPIKSLWFADDDIANRRTVPELLKHYRNAKVETECVAPADVGLAGIGHLGFFSGKAKNALWRRAVDWLDRQL